MMISSLPDPGGLSLPLISHLRPVEFPSIPRPDSSLSALPFPICNSIFSDVLGFLLRPRTYESFFAFPLFLSPQAMGE